MKLAAARRGLQLRATPQVKEVGDSIQGRFPCIGIPDEPTSLIMSGVRDTAEQ